MIDFDGEVLCFHVSIRDLGFTIKGFALRAFFLPAQMIVIDLL